MLLAPCVIMDLRKKELPLVYMLIFLPLSAAWNLFFARITLWDMVFGLLTGGVFLLVSWGTRGAIGFGDGVMMGATGVWMGGLFVIGASMAAFLTAGIFGIIYLKIRKLDRKTKLPFAPFFTAACLTMAVIGALQGG